MDDFTDGRDSGWVSAIQEAERRCERMWHNNEFVYAVPWTELVQIRRLVELAQKGRNDA